MDMGVMKEFADMLKCHFTCGHPIIWDEKYGQKHVLYTEDQLNLLGF